MTASRSLWVALLFYLLKNGAAFIGRRTRTSPRTKMVWDKSLAAMPSRPTTTRTKRSAGKTMGTQHICHHRGDSHLSSRPLKWRRVRKAIGLAVVGCVASRASQAVAATATPVAPPTLGWKNIATAASLIIGSGGIALSLSGLPTLAFAIMKACVRSTLQLYLVGGYLLTRFLVASNTRPWMVGAWVLFTGLMAGREAASRVEYTYDALPRHLTLSLMAGGLSVMGATLLLRVLDSVNPWYDPRTWIPIAGMLFGNSLTATSLAIATLTKEMAMNQNQIELRLSQGATLKEALNPVRKTVYSTAFSPVINFLSVAGIVHIPGMMAGQLLAGQSPFQAAAYQLVIFFLIASTATTTVQILVRLAENYLVDRKSDRLLTSRLEQKIPCKVKRNWPLSSLKSVWRPLRRIFRIRNDTSSSKDLIDIHRQPPLPQVLELKDGLDHASSEKVSVLKADSVYSSRANAYMSLSLHYDDRVALMGPSGAGKSQLLRTLAGLESVDRTAMQLLEEVGASQISMAEWRSHVMLVPQHHPFLEGTPNDFFREANSYASQEALVAVEQQGGSGVWRKQSHLAYGQQWGLKAELFDQPWSTLSGGESQRIRLAIALALQPDVLLLDECTSAMDEATTLQVETTLKALRTPVIMVSHSPSQVERFCNKELYLAKPSSTFNASKS